MAPVGCPRCRLLQLPGPMCVHCAGPPPVELVELTADRIEGITKVGKPPAQGWRDGLAVVGTATGVISAAMAGVVLGKSMAGLLLAPAFAALGYRKQFWKSAFVRRPRLGTVAPRPRPAGNAVVGVARAFERTVVARGTRSPALVMATTILDGQGVLLRAIEAVPFWLVTAERRVLITGACWATSPRPDVHDQLDDRLRELDAMTLPITRRRRPRLTVAQVTIAPGDQIAVVGSVREEPLAGGGYRDTIVDTIRGEPGSAVWIDLVEPASS